MNKLSYNMTQLLNELQTFKSITKEKGKEGEANVAKAQSSTSSNKNRKRKKKTRGSGKPQGGPKHKKSKSTNNKKSSKEKKPKGKCSHCGVDGHQKRNCNKYLDELREKRNKGKSDLQFLKACLVEDDTSHWIIDLGATNHVCSSLQILSSSRELAKGEFTLRVGIQGRLFQLWQWEQLTCSLEINVYF